MLERVAADTPDAGVSVAKLHVLSRTFTGVGSFTEFLVKGQPKDTPRRVIGTSFGVNIPALKRGLGVVLFKEKDNLTLETYSYDEPWDGVHDGFSLDSAA